nr:uncharacterized protein LOC104084895 [Nicotiana tomentosiformis]
MKMHLTHNISIKTMEDAKRHLELEEERLGVDKATTSAYVASFDPNSGKGKKRKFSGFFRKKGKGQAWKKPKTNHQGKNDVSVPKPKKKLNMAKLKCHNCKNKGHFDRDCPEPKKTREPPTM